MNEQVSNERARTTPACRTLRVAAAAALALLTASEAGAAHTALTDLTLEDLLRVEVVSASRFAQPISEAPATVTVIGENELRQRGYRTLADALVTVPGVYATDDRSYTSLGVRGFNRPGDYGTRVLLLTDGVRRNDAVYHQALFGNEAPIETDWVKRLEFVSGPASAVYGSNALFGTVNAVMLDGGDVNGTRVTLDTGEHNSKRLGLVAGQRLAGERDWFIGFAAYRSDGANPYFREYDNGVTDGRARGLEGERYEKAYAKLRWKNWRLTANLSSRKKDVATAWYESSFGQKGTSARDESALVDLSYEGEVERGWQTAWRVFAGRYRFDGRYAYAPLSDARDYAAANWVGSELRLSYSDIPGHKLMVGVDVQENTRVEQRYFEIAPRNMILDTNDPSHLTSVFVQDEWRFSPDWLLNIGLRHDKTSDFDAVTSPRLALVWQPTQRLSLKAMVGDAYRVPNAYERFYNDGGVSWFASRGLRPEHIESSELAAAWRFGPNGRVGASVYKNEMRDLIDATTDGSGAVRYANRDKVHARGIELYAENQWAAGYRLRGSVSAQRSEGDDGERLVNSPRLAGKLVFGAPLAFGWSAAGELLALSQRRGDNGPVSGYGIVNLTLSSAPNPRLGQLSLRVTNAGDRRFSEPTSSYMAQRAIVQDGRQLLLSWTVGL